MASEKTAERVFQVTTEVYLFPHSNQEGFVVPADLKRFLDGRLMRRSGRYRVVAANRYQGPQRGDLVLFHKGKHFVGEARVARALRTYSRPQAVSDIVYTGELIFDPKSIRSYPRPVSFDAAKNTLKSFTVRSPCKVNWAVHTAVLAHVR